MASSIGGSGFSHSSSLTPAKVPPPFSTRERPAGSSSTCPPWRVVMRIGRAVAREAVVGAGAQARPGDHAGPAGPLQPSPQADFFAAVQVHGGAAIGGLHGGDMMRVDVERSPISRRDLEKPSDGSLHWDTLLHLSRFDRVRASRLTDSESLRLAHTSSFFASLIKAAHASAHARHSG